MTCSLLLGKIAQHQCNQNASRASVYLETSSSRLEKYARGVFLAVINRLKIRARGQSSGRSTDSADEQSGRHDVNALQKYFKYSKKTEFYLQDSSSLETSMSYY